jgi:two-component system sensor histidine kinase/response regulator
MKQATILIVDDEPVNIAVLSDLLSPYYQIRGVPSGVAALRAVNVTPIPDLILLDVMMPQMDGYTVLGQLSENPNTQDIPVIFITALDDAEDEKKGFDLGAVDYIAKPIRPSIVLARVKTQIELKRIRDQLKTQNLQLAKKIEELKASESMRDSLLHMIVHDLKSPLSGIIGYLSLFDNHKNTLPDNLNRYLSGIGVSATALMDMINNLLDLHRFENQQTLLRTEKILLTPLIEEALRCMGSQLNQYTLDLQLPKTEIQFEGDRDMLRRLLINLLSNAQRYSLSHSVIQILVHQDKTQVHISVKDQGIGIAPEAQASIFQKFGSLKTLAPQKGRSTGLGLPFCKFAAEAHQGSISLESTPGEGSCFSLHLPLVQPVQLPKA